jgi:hypothetical protein
MACGSKTSLVAGIATTKHEVPRLPVRTPDKFERFAP